MACFFPQTFIIFVVESINYKVGSDIISQLHNYQLLQTHYYTKTPNKWFLCVWQIRSVTYQLAGNHNQALPAILFHRAQFLLTFSSIEKCHHQMEVMHEGSQS